MSQHAEASQTTTPSIALPCEIVTNAADIVMAELLTLHDYRNKQYWKRAMHVIWEQLTHVHPLVEELPSKFTIPTHIIAAKMIMRDLVVLMALKEWLNFDKIRDTMDANVTDHLWYQIGRPVDKGKGLWKNPAANQLVRLLLLALILEVEGHRSIQATAGASTGCGHLVATLATPATGYMPVAEDDQCDRDSCQKYRCSILTGVKAMQSQSRRPCSRAVTEVPDGTVDCPQTIAATSNPSQCCPQSPSPGPSATISSEPTTPTWQTQKWWASTRSMTPAAGKTATLAAPSSCRQMVIITPSWQQSGWQTSSLASWGVATSQSHLTTPSCPVTPNATPMECMEEEITAFQQQNMEMAHNLLETHHELADTQQALADTQTKLQMLCDVVKALHQHLYPLPHSSPDAPGPSCPSPIGFAITSHQAVIPTDGARILDLAPTMMVQEVAIDTSIHQNLLGDMLFTPSTLLPPPHHFAYSSTPGVGEAWPPIYVSLGAVADCAGGDDADDEDAANWMDVD
ncbi:hypothetical protein F5J12DRAFT_895599 [Pisolithus orientalis]|uniref:uncharacterized protein n=1 Tax=Pisolithus orientalis TaxID=936130 RepID=UPI002224904C|nr:uncharacterized protein F5J12DRAFT_895599 [Pisolithus orientalis]KAI5998409.1 hypothetical protein F5J12DRAFT_895599 [Pisolithus orientalis]